MNVAEHYAVVADLQILRSPLPDGVIKGFAIPHRGKKPCALALKAGGDLVSIAPAIEFSIEAARAGLRFGWCGFDINGLQQAAALADIVELRCLASDRILAWWDSAALACELAVPHRTPIRLEQMLARIRRIGSSTDIEQVFPFGLDLARRRGTASFLRATWRYFFQRDINPEELQEWGEFDYITLESIKEMWQTLLSSPESVVGRYYNRPGPFAPDFPFSLDIFCQ